MLGEALERPLQRVCLSAHARNHESAVCLRGPEAVRCEAKREAEQIDFQKEFHTQATSGRGRSK